MNNPKEFYRSYIADDNLSALNARLSHVINQLKPNHVFEFGMGSGKNLKILPEGVGVGGLDVSFVNVAKAHLKNDIQFVMVGDETHLRHLCNYDVVFTCSVLDHIEDIDGIVAEFIRIANKAVVIAETNDTPGDYYYPHDYEKLGFKRLDYQWVSNGDGATYHIWILEKFNQVKNTKDDLA